MVKVLENLNLTESSDMDESNKKYIQHTTNCIIDEMKQYQRELNKANSKMLAKMKFISETTFTSMINARQSYSIREATSSIGANNYTIGCTLPAIKRKRKIK